MNEGVLGVEGRVLVRVGLAVDDVVPPDVAALGPRHVLAGAPHDENLLDAGAGDRLVGGGLER